MVEGNEGDPHIIWIVAIEPAPEKGFVTASQSIAEVLGFADVEQSFNAMSKGVQTNFSRNSVEVVAEGMAPIKGGKGESALEFGGLLAGWGWSWKLGYGSGYSILQVEAIALLMNSKRDLALSDSSKRASGFIFGES